MGTTLRSASGRESNGLDLIRLDCELLISWHHDPQMPIRYRVIAHGGGEVMIASTLPLVHGVSGVLTRLLPAGTDVRRTVSVRSCRPNTERGGAGYVARLVIA